ncbi:MAG TPA: ATP-binding protein [Thermoanaerobaculia bacterium]|nr:ATP-binding protein [Thermoanaerobaculia bacterium]
MRSLRGRLTVWLLAGAGLLLLLGALALARLTAVRLQREFDEALVTKARSLATLTEQEEGRVWLELADEIMPEFEKGPGPEYFQIWRADGGVVARSGSLGNRDLPRWQGGTRLDQPLLRDGRLPDGRPGRVAEIRFHPRDEEAESDGRIEAAPSPSPPVSHVPPVTLVLARSREPLDSFISFLRAILAGFVLVLLAGLAVLVRLSLAVGLAPVDRLAARLRELDAESLDQRLDAAETPTELAPVVEHLNGLLERLQGSFARERTFSANLAHEFRTPLAELRTLAEVALRWPDDAAATAESLADIHAVGLQMESIVVDLLDLARCEGGLHVVRSGELALGDAVEECWGKIEEKAAARGISLVREISPQLLVTTDREKLDRILINVFSNAVAYSPAGSEVRCAACPAGSGFFLSVSNPTDSLEADDLSRVFDRFWRKDPARTESGHAGLGLSLVAAFCALLGIHVEARLSSGRVFEIRLQGAG